MLWFAASVVVSLGMGALVIDMGALWSERRQLQNGADAAALAVGIECAYGPCVAPETIAQEYADLNVNDGSANIDSICGLPSPLMACPPPPGAENALGFVEVITGTAEDGSDQIKYLLAPILEGTDSGKHVTARAVAAWGTPMGAPIMPFVFSKCVVEPFRGTDGTMNFPNSISMLKFHNAEAELDPTSPESVCNATQENLELKWPAGFGFTGSPSTGCESETVTLNPDDGSGTQTGSIEGENNGNSIGQECTAELIRRYNLDLPVLVPVMTWRTGNGGTTIWEIDGFVAVSICAFDLSGSDRLELNGCGSSGAAGNTSCSSPKVNGKAPRRICGVFQPYTLTDGDLGNSNDYGTRVIKLIG